MKRGLQSAFLVLLGLAIVTLAACHKRQSTAGGQMPAGAKPEVSVVTLHPQSVVITVELPGRTSASLVAEVRPQVSGIIQKRLYQEGSEVKAGDPLYQIDPASYQAALSSAQAALQKAEAAVPSVQARVERYQNLSKQNAVSKQDLDDAVATLAQANADVASAKAAVETARINLAYTKITAPIAGRTDRSSLTPGALVTANQDTLLTTIRKLDPINVDITASSANLLNLRRAIREGRIRISGTGITVRLRLENGELYPQTGKLEFAEAHVSETTGTFTARAQFPNPERLLLPGMYVRAIVEEGVAENSFLLPQRAVGRNIKGEATALFVTNDGKIEQRVVNVGRSIDHGWLVPTGIADGDRVVVEGSQFVHPGQDVSVVEVTIDPETGELREGQSRQPTAPAKN